MNDTCVTRRSRVPRRSSGRIKGGATRGPGQGPVSERRLSENSEYVNPEMRETLGFPFQNGRFVKPEKAG